MAEYESVKMSRAEWIREAKRLSRPKGLRDWWREGHPLVSRWTHKDDWTLSWVGKAANAYHHHTRWVRPSFWLNVWRAPERYRWVTEAGERRYRPYREWPRDLKPWMVRWCRVRGHGEIACVNVGGYEYPEPGYFCTRCDEEVP